MSGLEDYNSYIYHYIYESSASDSESRYYPSSALKQQSATTKRATVELTTETTSIQTASQAYLFLSILTITFVIVGTLGFISLLVGALCRQQRNSSSSWKFLGQIFVVNALALLTLPTAMMQELQQKHTNTSIETAENIRQFLLFFSAFASGLFLGAINFDQLFAKNDSMIKGKCGSNCFCGFVSALIWIVALVLAIPVFYARSSGTIATAFVISFYIFYVISLTINGLFGYVLWLRYRKTRIDLRVAKQKTKMEIVSENKNCKDGQRIKDVNKLLVICCCLATVAFHAGWIPYVIIDAICGSETAIMTLGDFSVGNFAIFWVYGYHVLLPYAFFVIFSQAEKVICFDSNERVLLSGDSGSPSSHSTLILAE